MGSTDRRPLALTSPAVTRLDQDPHMIMRLDRLQAEPPPPSTADPAGAAWDLLPWSEPGEVAEISERLRKAAGIS